jgi:hypothetical protein
MKDASPFVFARLWDGWQNPDTKEWLRSCVIITAGKRGKLRWGMYAVAGSFSHFRRLTTVPLTPQSAIQKLKCGDVPTKVRKTPRDLAQTGIYTTTHGLLRLQKSDCFQAANFGSLIRTESWELFVREIVFAQHVNILPGHDRAVCDGLE